MSIRSQYTNRRSIRCRIQVNLNLIQGQVNFRHLNRKISIFRRPPCRVQDFLHECPLHFRLLFSNEKCGCFCTGVLSRPWGTNTLNQGWNACRHTTRRLRKDPAGLSRPYHLIACQRSCQKMFLPTIFATTPKSYFSQVDKSVNSWWKLNGMQGRQTSHPLIDPPRSIKSEMRNNAWQVLTCQR